MLCEEGRKLKIKYICYICLLLILCHLCQMFDLLIFTLVFIHLPFQYFIFIYKICLPPQVSRIQKWTDVRTRNLQCKGPVVELRDMRRADKDGDSLWLRMVGVFLEIFELHLGRRMRFSRCRMSRKSFRQMEELIRSQNRKASHVLEGNVTR